jgi:hypothetical protein
MATKPKTESRTVQKKNEEPLPIDECVHQWMIDPPAGPTSEGHCKICGETRAFKNSLEISYWDSQRKKANAAKANAAKANAAKAAPSKNRTPTK